MWMLTMPDLFILKKMIHYLKFLYSLLRKIESYKKNEFSDTWFELSEKDLYLKRNRITL
jgi:hypothetical protein